MRGTRDCEPHSRFQPTASGQLLLGLIPVLLSACATPPPQSPSSTTNSTTGPVLKSEFIYESAPFPSCHASTIAETKGGLIAAWFGGTDERNPDVGIWISRHNGTHWSAPVEVANGVQDDGVKRFPCWNPVLFQPKDGPLLLFYKVGPSPSRWWGMLVTSIDGGQVWSKPRRLPNGFLGPIKNKPVALADGSLLCPSSTEHAGWRIHLERTSDFGLTWSKTEPLNDGKEFGVIQPTILFHPNNRLQLLCRSRQHCLTECWSEDGGNTWGPMRATALPNPNSGIDAVTLKDGRHLLVYNPTTRGRTPLVLSVSPDGRNWQKVATLEDEPGEYSYPAIIQIRDGTVHITYTWKRQRIKHVVVQPPP
jgi:predicted neuraminidase